MKNVSLVEHKKLQSFLENQRDINLVYHFGSSLSGEQHEESDLDLAILFDTKPEYQRILELLEQLTGILNRDVDLATLNDSSPVFKMQVITTGINIFCRIRKIKSYFVIRTFNEYDDLNYYRQYQKKNILKGRLFA